MQEHTAALGTKAAVLQIIIYFEVHDIIHTYIIIGYQLITCDVLILID